MHVWTASYFFSWIYCRMLSKNRFSQTLSTFTKTFHPFARKTKSQLGFMMLTELPPRAVGSNSAYTRSPIGCPGNVLFVCRTFFSLVSTFARRYYDSHYLENCIKGVFKSIFQPLQKAHVTSELRQRSFSWVFGDKLSRKHGYSEEFCSRIRCFWLNSRLSTFRPRCSETRFAEQKLAYVLLLRWHKSLSHLNSLWSYDSYLATPLSSRGCFLPNIDRFRFVLSGIA